MGVILDSNVLLDIFMEDPVWFEWSSKIVAYYAERTELIINPIIYAEVSIGFKKIEELEEVLATQYFTREGLPWEAAFLAGKAFLSYKKNKGLKTSPLPDFYIGAHAAITQRPLVTRDPQVYRNYFPKLKIISPNEAS